MSVAMTKTSLPAIESQVMCVTCKIPLSVAQSAQADRERAFIVSEIERGKSAGQVKQALVGQYGQQVLALPAARGFDAAAYLVPIVAAVLVLAVLALLLARWRRRGASAPASATAGGKATANGGPAAMSPADTARLESDLARFD
jgi:cytochrome c-type biogenesis protein CcmH/NrfF